MVHTMWLVAFAAVRASAGNPGRPALRGASEHMCFSLSSTMYFNNLVQSFPNNPDSHAKGFATFKLCTNGTLMSDTALVYGGQTPLIASHIHLATDGDGVNGNGPPVISFCGDNTPGLINAAGPYPDPCAPYVGGNSNNAHMKGYLISGENKGTTLSARVLDIASNPGKYYFNFHSIASWAYWSAQSSGPIGMCRGVMQLSNAPVDRSRNFALETAADLKVASAGASSAVWLPLDGSRHNVAVDEGKFVGKVTGSLQHCETACDKQWDCESFAFCEDGCYLRGKRIAADAPRRFNKYCTTYRKDDGSDMCFSLFSTMSFNNLVQSFPNNPDSHANGIATFKLCTNGTLMSDTALVYGGQTPLIASHIHLAADSDGVNGSGPPVISFCGDNTPGLINAAGPYPEPCAPYVGGASNNAHMKGYLIPGENKGTILSARVRDIAANPGKYYFNFHSIASWAYWSAQNKGPVGMCRGVIQLSERTR